MTDAQMISRILEGDEKGTLHLYKIANKHIPKMVLKNSGNAQQAKDIVQETVIVFWRKLTEENLILSCKASTYLYSVAWNLWRKELSRMKRFDDNGLDEFAYTSVDTVIANEQVGIVQDAIEQLPVSCQLIMEESMSGTSMKDIAQKLGYKNAESAKTQKWKCMKALEEIITDNYTEEDIKN